MNPEKGNKAPEFQGIDQDGKTIKLSDYKGKKVILYFYPKDDTPGCTKEACNLRDNYDKLFEKGFAIIGISSDDEKSHKKFADKYGLPFPLIADTDKRIHDQYGTWVEKSMYGREYMGTARSTFVIGEDGNILEIIDKVKTDDHANQILGE